MSARDVACALGRTARALEQSAIPAEQHVQRRDQAGRKQLRAQLIDRPERNGARADELLGTVRQLEQLDPAARPTQRLYPFLGQPRPSIASTASFLTGLAAYGRFMPPRRSCDRGMNRAAGCRRAAPMELSGLEGRGASSSGQAAHAQEPRSYASSCQDVRFGRTRGAAPPGGSASEGPKSL